MNILICAFLLMPPHPELKERLVREGKWNDVKNVLIQAKQRGVDAPDFENLKKFRIRMLERQSDTLSIPVILVEFTDNLAESSKTHYEEMLFSVGTYPTGSLTDYYLENSYGDFFINGWVSDWLMMPHNYAYYVDGQYGFGQYPQNAQGLARDAVLAADPYVDFSQFDRDNNGYVDAIFVVHAGPGAEETGNPNDIWSHAWYIPGGVQVDGVIVYRYSMEPENGRMGVFGHELGHVLGLPDLYDTDYSSEGLGNWSMMAGGSWGGNGRVPVHFDAWCKKELGFLTPTNVTGIIENAVFPPVEEFPVAYRLWSYGNSSPQYFLAEFRSDQKGFDKSLPEGGLLVFHVDENQQNNNNEWYPGHTNYGHYKVALEQADGDWDLEKGINRGDPGDPYPGATNNRNFDDYSIPDSKDYNFSTTYVSITGISDFGDTMYADLAVIPVYNLALDSLVVPPVVPKDSSFVSKIYFSNRGFYGQNFSITLKIDSAGTNLHQETLSGLYLAPGEKDSAQFSPFTVHWENGFYNLTTYITSGNDQLHRNDTIKYDLYSYVIKRFVNATYSTNLPSIDGVIQSSEWADAYAFDVSDFLAKDGKINVAEATAFVKNSDSVFYIGIILEDTTSGIDMFRIFFDDNADGSFPPYPESTEGEIRIHQTTSGFNITYRPYYSSGQAGPPQAISLPFGANFTNGNRSYELAVPLVHHNYALDEEIGVSSPTDTFGTYILVRDGSRSDNIANWPQDASPYNFNDPSYYGKIEVTNVNIGIKERDKKENILSFAITPDKEGYRIKLILPSSQLFRLNLYDIIGRRLWETNKTGKEFETVISSKDFSKGVYFLKLDSEKVKRTKKIVIY
jgi:immune inhibitor A